MVCEDNGTFFDINIPSILLPRSAGDTLEAGLLRDETGALLVCFLTLIGLHFLRNLFC